MIMTDFVSDFLSPTQEFKHISRLYEFETGSRNQLSISVSSRQTSHDCAGKCCVFFKRRRGFHRVFNSVSCSLTFFTCVAKYLKDKKRNSVSFARKYVRIFVLGYYLFLEAHSFRILEQKIREIDRGQIFALILVPNWSKCLYSAVW